MSIPHQPYLVGGLWGILLTDAVRQGLLIPQANFPNEQQHFWIGALFGLLAPPLVFAATYFFGLSRPYRPGFVARWVDQRFGQGSALSFMQTLRPILLMGCAALVLGSVGLLSALHAGSGLAPYGVALFFFFAGGWFVLGSILLRRRLPHVPF
jgi:hypothetical protein